MKPDSDMRRLVLLVALLNLFYFGIEFAVALAIDSVSLFADSIDFLEDASVNFHHCAGARLVAARPFPGGDGAYVPPSRAGHHNTVDGVGQVSGTDTAQPFPLLLAGMGALAINLSCAFMLAAYRHDGGSLTKAAFLSARNDAFPNIAIIAAGLVTAFVWRSAWPDLIVGLAIAAMKADATREVWTAARQEHRVCA